MPIELICLVVLALWTIPLNHTPALGRIAVGGVTWALGDRDTIPKTDPWVGRAERAQRNHLDNLGAIAAILLITILTQQSDAITQVAAIVIVVARICHGLFYIAGIGLLRSLSYLVAVLALFTIVWRLFF